MRRIFSYPIVFICTIAVFFVAMTLAYCIPAEWVAEHVSESVEQFHSEGTYPMLFFGLKGSWLDNFTDELMVNMNRLSNKGNPVILAMDNLGYARYWHGYQVVLRFLLVFLNIRQIRYLATFVFFFILCILFLKLKERVEIGIALSFLFVMCSTCLILIPVSLQYSSVFYITLLFMLYLLRLNEITKAKHLPLAFMIVGMFTNFFDLLTVPMITLGLPLLLYLVLNIRSGNAGWGSNIKTMFLLCAFWGIGYGFCWISKWVIAGIVTRENVVKSAIDQIFFRTMGNEEYPVSRFGAIGTNFSVLFIDNKLFGALMLLVVLALTICAVLFRTTKERAKQSTLFLIVAVFPYVWYFVLANHSSIHAWFTYRLQAITVFSVLLTLFWLVDWAKAKDFIVHLKEKGRKYFDKFFQKK